MGRIILSVILPVCLSVLLSLITSVILLSVREIAVVNSYFGIEENKRSIVFLVSATPLYTKVTKKVKSTGLGRGKCHPATTPYPPRKAPAPIHSASSDFLFPPVPVPRPPCLKFHLWLHLRLQDFLPRPRPCHFHIRVLSSDFFHHLH